MVTRGVESVREFLNNPRSDELFKCKREQLIEIAEALNLEFKSSDLKIKLRNAIGIYYIDQCIFPDSLVDEFTRAPLTAMEYEQLKLERERMLVESERLERVESEKAGMLERIEIEKIRAAEETKLKIARLANSSREASSESRGRGVTAAEAVSSDNKKAVRQNVKLVPPFNEKDVDSYFNHFEKVAGSLEWEKAIWPLLLQTVLKGKAQEVYTSLSVEQSKDYDVVKASILKGYELIPEAHRQKFRNLRREEGKTHVEFASKKLLYFDRWCHSKSIDEDYDNLKELVLVEDFKQCIREDVRTFLNEKEIDTLEAAAEAADNFVLTHKSGYAQNRYKVEAVGSDGKSPSHKHREKASGVFSGSSSSTQERSAALGPKCSYCKKFGHSIHDCRKLKYNNSHFKNGKKDKVVGSVSSKNNSYKNKQRSLTASTQGVTQQNNKRVEVHKELLPFVYDGTVSLNDELNNDSAVNIKMLRDTGCCQSLMWAEKLPKNSVETGDYVLIRGIDLNYTSVPLYEVFIRSSLITSKIRVGVIDHEPAPGIDSFIGNDVMGGKMCNVVPILNSGVNVKVNGNATSGDNDLCLSGVVTRSKTRQKLAQACVYDDVKNVDGKKAIVNDEVCLADTFLSDDNLCDVINAEENVNSKEGRKMNDNKKTVSKEQLRVSQREDASLKKLFDQVVSNSEVDSVHCCYYLINDILMRKWRPSNVPADDDSFVEHQIVLPKAYRQDVLQLAHKAPLSGHLGRNKTYWKICKNFYWPGIQSDVKEFIKTCHTCQVAGKAQSNIVKAPLYPIPVIGDPFSRVIIDCVGRLPKTKSGFQYILTIMDVATRFPEAIPLRNIKAKTVANALIKFFTSYGLPIEIQSDQGSNFTSNLMQQLTYKLGIKQVFASAYHSESQGALERYHQTLKSMIRAYCYENEQDWAESLPLLVFAARDAVQESLGFSAFELVFGHSVRGPVKLLKEKFLDDKVDVNILDFVSNFKEKLKNACKVASDNLVNAQRKMKVYYDRKARARTFCKGDKVLVLLPIVSDPLSAKFHGPYTVSKKIDDLNYVVETPDRRKSTQLCHVNMIKPYFEAKATLSVLAANNKTQTDEINSQADVINLNDNVDTDVNVPNAVLFGKLKNSEVLCNLDEKFSHLQANEKNDMINIFNEYSGLFNDVPSVTNVICHDIDVNDHPPIKQHPYRLSPTKLKLMRGELDYMLENGIAEPSQSAWSSPVVMIPKTDGSVRFCTDFRKVNQVTVGDSQPIPRISSCIDEIGTAKYLTKIDMLKGYWSVPLTERAKSISAFVTPEGLFQYKVMAFGLRNSGATYQRLINKCLEGIPNAKGYIDDVLLFSSTWLGHVNTIKEVFKRLLDANLTVNLSKSDFGKAQVLYLGHVIGNGCVAPAEAKVNCIVDYPVPVNVKQLRRFLGIVGFFRNFCPNFSLVASPLTDLLKKNVKFVWSDQCIDSFQNLKAMLCNKPVLKSPNFDQSFTLVTDASDIAAAAMLAQNDKKNVQHPVSFYSKKFDKHQQKYSTVEKECLSIVLALKHFEVYVDNGHPITIYTDHNPLVFLNKMKCKNRRLLSWSLFLQQYDVNIVHIKGRENVVADGLSRV